MTTAVGLPEASTCTIDQSFRTSFKLVPHHREEPLAVGSKQLLRTPSTHTYTVSDWYLVKMGGLEHYREYPSLRLPPPIDPIVPWKATSSHFLKYIADQTP